MNRALSTFHEQFYEYDAETHRRPPPPPPTHTMTIIYSDALVSAVYETTSKIFGRINVVVDMINGIDCMRIFSTSGLSDTRNDLEKNKSSISIKFLTDFENAD